MCKLFIPTNIFKLSINSYISSLTDCLNHCIENSIFTEELKLADIRPIFKKVLINQTTDLLVFYQLSQKFSRECFMTN